MPTLSEIGWGWPGLSRKAHVFADGIALCRRWMFTGKLDPFLAMDKPGPDDCKVCWKLAMKRIPVPPQEVPDEDR